MPFITSTDDRWQSLLSEVQHDIYHLPGYCVLEATLLNGIAVAWYHVSGTFTCLIPLISRAIDERGNYHDLVSPYGYPGILSSKPLTVEEAENIFATFHLEAAENAYVSSFIRLNPLLNQWMFENREGWLQWLHGETVSVALEGQQSQIRNSFSKNHLRNLRHLERLGFLTTVNDWNSLKGFIQAYRQTMKRRNAPPHYFFPDHYFYQLIELLGEKLVYITVNDSNGIFASGGLFTLFGNIMQYHLGATADEFVHFSPSKLMMDAAIGYGLVNAASLLHLGGGLGGSTSDGLFRFKKGFGHNYHTYSSLRFIHRPAEYLALKPEDSEYSKNNDYFPEYRNKSVII